MTFVDDGLSTNVLPTLAAVEAFPDQRVALIVGGQDRGIDYRPLGEGLRSRTAPVRVLAVPDNGPHIRAMIEAAAPGPAVEHAGLPRPSGRGPGGLRVGSPGRCRAAVARRPELRALPRLPRTRSGVRRRDGGVPVAADATGQSPHASTAATISSAHAFSGTRVLSITRS